jgi:uncharacterized protein RhaS with RHS repeats
VTDALGRVTVTDYDQLNRPTTLTEDSGNPDARTTSREYDVVGNLTTLTTGIAYDDPLSDHQETTAYTFNNFNDVLTTTQAAGSTTTTPATTQKRYRMDGLVDLVEDPVGGYTLRGWHRRQYRQGEC